MTVSSPVLAEDISSGSTIDAVTVFPRGAEVKRVAKVRIGAGSHAVVINDLPAEALAASIRVEGKATGVLEIGAVDSRRLSVPSTDAETIASERRRLEDEIQRLRDERARIGADAQAAEAQRTFITNLLQLPSRSAPPAGAAQPREDWAQILALIGREMAPVNKAVLDAGVRIREVDRRIADAQGKLRAVAPRVVQRTEVRIAVSARAPTDAELTVRYQIMQAGWRPHYDARLDSGAKDRAPRLTFTRRATVTQRTTESWDQVALSLSTARPSARSAAPELRPVTVDFPPDRPQPAPVAAPAAREMSMNRQLRAAKPGEPQSDVAQAAAPAKPKMEAAGAASAQVSAGTFQAIYQIGGRHSVPNANQAKSVQIDDSDFRDIQLKVRTAPREDPRAYLYASFKVPAATPWLAGQVALFRDGTFVGNGSVPQLAPGQAHDLGFGADDRVRVEARSTQVTRGETGIISQSKTDQRNWRLSIKSLHAQPVTFELLDQMPVSNNQDIKIELIARPQPSRRNVDDKRGVLAWDDKLAAGEEKVIEFGYRVSWPAAKSIVYGR